MIEIEIDWAGWGWRCGMEISDVEWRGSCSGEDACRRKDCVGMYVMDCVILSYTSKRTMWGACCLCGRRRISPSICLFAYLSTPTPFTASPLSDHHHARRSIIPLAPSLTCTSPKTAIQSLPCHFSPPYLPGAQFRISIVHSGQNPGTWDWDDQILE